MSRQAPAADAADTGSSADVSSRQADRRVLALLPNARDADLTRRVLGRSGIDVLACNHLADVCAELRGGAAALLLPEEVLADAAGRERLLGWLGEQPPWSDLPLLVTSRHGADSGLVQQAMEQLGNVTILERPLRIASLVSAAKTALRARERQYQLRDHLAERERADRRKDEFLAMLAHELRNPLAPVTNALHLLRRLDGANAAAVHLLDLMGRQVGQMVRLIDDLLDVSRITRGKIELKWDWVDLRAVVAQAVETARPVIEAGSHRLHVDLPPRLPALRGDAVRLAQVLANLLNNAAKYSDSPGDIWIAARVDGDELEVAVRDAGMGLSPSMLPRVFDLFQQMDHTAARANGGLGIGLTLVRRLVEMHGGRVHATSPGLGLGSTFVLRLPVVRSADTADPMPPVAQHAGLGQPPAQAPHRLLLVDDNRDAADSLAELLSVWGIEVRVEYDAPAALAALDGFRPTVVVLDLGLPTMDGYAVAQAIRQRAEFADVHLIALTGWGQETDRVRARRAGFDHHLVKPADLEELRTALSAGRAH